jgi:drug/metabolite transporter (DMT)-like permease
LLDATEHAADNLNSIPRNFFAMKTADEQVVRARGEPWALGTVVGYASAAIFDRMAVEHANALLGPFLRGVPSLLLGLVLVWKNRTWGQMRPASPSYVGGRAIVSFLSAGVLSTIGLFAYYLAIRLGGVTITAPVQETYVIWGTLIAWFFLKERFQGYVLMGIMLITLGLVALSVGEMRGAATIAARVSSHWYWAIPLALFTAFTYGISGVLWRDGQLRGAHQSTAILLQFASSVTVGLLGLVLLGRLGLLLAIPRGALLALLWSGVLSGIIAIYCMFTALRIMEVARVYAFTSLTPIVATLCAHFLLHEYMNLLIVGGVMLVSIGVTLTQVFRPKSP